MNWPGLLALVPLTLAAGCVTPGNMTSNRHQLLGLLEKEMHGHGGWVRIHAADALLDHHQPQRVAPCFRAEAQIALPPYRIGVWRVLARSATTPEQRDHWVERLRSVMRDTQAPDRLSAAESLAKLQVKLPADSLAIQRWLAEADDATAPFPLWLLVLASPPDERDRQEARLTNLLESSNAVARLRAGFALGRLETISPTSRARLRRRAEMEPVDSPARPYLLSAALLQNKEDPPLRDRLRQDLLACLRQGQPVEQLEAAMTLGKRGTAADEAALRKLLSSSEPDARIGAASGLLFLLP